MNKVAWTGINGGAHASIVMQKRASLMSGFASASSAGVWMTSIRPMFSRAQLAHTADGTAEKPVDAKKRIMVVDDEKDISFVLKSGLERNGFIVEVFNDPVVALSHFKPSYYELLLLDVKMPTMSGFELCREIRRQDRDARVCFITAFEVHEDELRKYLPEEGDKCIVKKPVSIRELIKVINEEISRKA